MTQALRRVAATFAAIERDTPHECEFCGARAPAGQRFCDEHEAEFATRH
jgi:predicted nucleic acid-binding Zn ribbon protein